MPSLWLGFMTWGSIWDSVSDVRTEGGLLDTESVLMFESFLDETIVNCYGILEFLGSFITRGVSEGRFTEKEARHNLGIALWVAYTCNNPSDYEHYYTAAEWLSRVEDRASGCGVWHYRYANAIVYYGKSVLALEYCECGVAEDPGYPWLWLTLGRPRVHFSDRAEAIKAAERSLKLVPGDHEFLTLLHDIGRSITIEEMEMHIIDPEDDEDLADLGDADPEYGPKALAVSGPVCDRRALEAIRGTLGLTGWSCDHLYCTALMGRAGSSVVVTFIMGEIQLSKMDPSGLRTILDSADAMDAEALSSHSSSGVEGTALFGVSIGPYGDVKLSYAASGS